MTAIAIIPARKGSKRLPGKNSRLLGERPLAQWTVDCAKESNIFSKIIFSTDDPNLAEAAREWGCVVPGLRPAELSHDKSDLVSVCLHLIENRDLQIRAQDILFLLQPTSPFRKPETLRLALEMIKSKKPDSVISFSQSKIKPEWLHYIDPQGYTHSIVNNADFKAQTPSQIYYVPNGLVYAAYVETIKKLKTFYTSATLPLICTDSLEAIDIDEPYDWDFAESSLRKLREISLCSPASSV